MNQVMLIGKVDYVGEGYLDIKIKGTDGIIPVKVPQTMLKYVEQDAIVGIRGKVVNDITDSFNTVIECERLTMLSTKDTEEE